LEEARDLSKYYEMNEWSLTFKGIITVCTMVYENKSLRKI